MMLNYYGIIVFGILLKQQTKFTIKAVRGAKNLQHLEDPKEVVVSVLPTPHPNIYI